MPGDLLEPVNEGLDYFSGGPSRRSLTFEVRKDRRPVWVSPAVCDPLDCLVMGVGPAFGLVPDYFAEYYHGLPPGFMCIFILKISAAFAEKTPYKVFIRAGSRVILESAPGISLSAELRRKVARALSLFTTAA